MSEEVLLDRQGAIATVTLNRPDRLNAMNDALLDGLVDTLETLDDDKDLAVIVLRGAGRAFCVGGDLAAHHEPVGQSQAESRLRYHVRAAEILREGHAVSIASVNGPAAGAGFGLAAACDLRIVAKSAVFRSAFLTAAMSGDFGLGWSLTHLIGAARAHEILLLNEKISAAGAREIGLATRAFTPTRNSTTRCVPSRTPWRRDRRWRWPASRPTLAMPLDCRLPNACAASVPDISPPPSVPTLLRPGRHFWKSAHQYFVTGNDPARLQSCARNPSNVDS